jgi:FlgD Ig-like domain
MAFIMSYRTISYPKSWFHDSLRYWEHLFSRSAISKLGKIVSKVGKSYCWTWLLCAATLFSSVSVRATTTISFKLDEPCRTSAGIYKTDGTLVRTLWSNVRYYAAGTYKSTWDGKDDSGNLVSSGTYVVKVLQHNVKYIWDGAVGNTSAETYGAHTYAAYGTMEDLAIVSSNAFFCFGANEQNFQFRGFYTNDPTRVAYQWYWNGPANSIQNYPGSGTRLWNWITTDGNLLYFACDSTYTSANAYGAAGCIVASYVTNQNYYPFANGIGVPDQGNRTIPYGLVVGTQPGLSGLAVQSNGNILAVAVAPDNKIYLLNKSTGAASSPSSIGLNAPGRMSFDVSGNLWVCNSNSVVCYTNMNGTPAAGLIITAGLSSPLAVAANDPLNPNLVLVADGGSSQQLKAFDTNGTSLWTYGQAGGYSSNGPVVTTNKFWFSKFGVPDTFVSFAPDGSFWVGDGENNRTLHFDINQNYIEQIMQQPVSYSLGADQNNPSRVFNNFLEFAVDYTKPMANGGWVLVKNWKANVGTAYTSLGTLAGLSSVFTLTNGRTYGLLNNTDWFSLQNKNLKELVELTSTGLRFTGIAPCSNNIVGQYNNLGPDGSAYGDVGGSATFYKAQLSGFDGSNNPQWGAITTLASASAGAGDPTTGGANRYATVAISANNDVISFKSSVNGGMHLGGVPVGGSAWQWKSSPTGTLNGDGHFETNSVTYAGGDVQTIDHNIVYGYHGEFFRGQAQACQHLHFYDDGLFIGEFGETWLGYTPLSRAPASAGNGFGPVMVKTNDEYYCYENDEGGHGLQRWHLANARNIREATGTGLLNGTITLTNPIVSFPTVLTGTSADQGCRLSWNAVSGAILYNVYYSLNNGGPYLTLAGGTGSTNYAVNGLTDGVTYYFVVKAVVNGVESPASEQININPFDTSKNVIATGLLVDDMVGHNLTLTNISANVSSNFPVFIGMGRYCGSIDYEQMGNEGFTYLKQPQIGSRGYLFYGFNGSGTVVSNLAPGFVITNSGWGYANYIIRDMVLDGAMDNTSSSGDINYTWAIYPNPTGYIYVHPSDTNYHVLTITSPSESTSARTYSMTLTATNGDAATYAVNEMASMPAATKVAGLEMNGACITMQWFFRGDSTLTASNNIGRATVQALYLDDVPAAISSTPNPPGLLQIISK